MISQNIIRRGTPSQYQAHITISFPLAIHRVRGEKPLHSRLALAPCCSRRLITRVMFCKGKMEVHA